jgi:hypothetical protein
MTTEGHRRVPRHTSSDVTPEELSRKWRVSIDTAETDVKVTTQLGEFVRRFIR